MQLFRFAARLASAGAALVLACAAQAQGSNWTNAGQNLGNIRHQAAESEITPATVGRLGVKWAFTTAGDVSAILAVEGNTVYFPDWAGFLYAVDRQSGALKWKSSISQATGIPGDKARATPAISGNKLVLGTQGPFGGGGKVLAFNKTTGQLLWSTQLDSHPAALITQSATVHAGKVYVGVASLEEAYAGFFPGYPCCSFRGSIAALNLDTGAILWKTMMAPEGFSGNAVWGSAPAIDVKRGQLYIATGNNYQVPSSVLDCALAAGVNTGAAAACNPADNRFDAIVALDLLTGVVRWSTAGWPFDTWTVSCFPFVPNVDNCPSSESPDYDFAQAPSLFSVRDPATGQLRDRVGAGQKSGKYWSLDPDTGAVIWSTQAGPGGTAGGLQWGSAVDGQRIYTANSNSNFQKWTLPNGDTVISGVWSALDAATGKILWQTSPRIGGSTSGPVTTTNGIVFGCSLDATGPMYALEATTGAVLWEFASGGSCLSGAAISNGMVFWGSGYSNLGFGTPNNKLYAFELK